MNQTKTVLLLGILSVLLIGIGTALAPGQLYTFVGLAVIMNVISYFYSDKLVLMMHQAQEVSPAEAPGLHRVVEELSLKAGISKPRVFLIPADYANAFATGRNPEHGVVAVTKGILRTLGERELRGVLAHEIGHIKNRDILIASLAAVLASAISIVADVVRWGALLGGRSSPDGDQDGPGYSIALAIIAPLAAMLLQLGISRSREFVADETAARITGDPEAMALALQSLHRSAEAMPVLQAAPATASLFIVNPLAGFGSWMNLFSTHPPVEERIARLLALRGGIPR